MNAKTNQSIYYQKHTNTMIMFRDLESGRVYQYNGSERNMNKLDKFVCDNWSDDLTAAQINDFGFSLKNIRHYSRAN